MHLLLVDKMEAVGWLVVEGGEHPRALRQILEATGGRPVQDDGKNKT